MGFKVFVVDDSTSYVRLLKECFNENDEIKSIINSLEPSNINSIIINVNNTYINKDKEIENKVTVLLHNLGIPSHIKGYSYIRSSILMVYNNPNYVGKITKELYPKLSIKYNTSTKTIERSIRHAIEVSWNRGDLELMDQLFGHSIDAYKSKPTNSEFIVTIADKLRLEN